MKNVLKTIPVVVKNGLIALNFKLSDVKAIAIVGVDLVALMQDGSRLLLPGLALKILERPSPELKFEDQQLSGADLFTKVDIDSTVLQDAAKALQVPVSEPTAHDPLGDSSKISLDATDSAAQDMAGKEDAGKEDAGKGEAPPQAWYQQYGWIFGLVGLAGLALGLSGGKKGGGKDEAPPAKPSPGGDDGTKPGGDDGTKPGGDDGTKPGGDDGTKPGGDDGTKPGGDDGTKPGGDDGTKPGEDPVVPPKTIRVTGSIVAGVFNTSDMQITLYDGKGNKLGTGSLATQDGQVYSYSAELPADYVGPVRVVLSDNAKDGKGYIDEFRQQTALAQGMTPEQAAAFASTDFSNLNAIGYVKEGQDSVDISITPLTELAARLLGVSSNPTDPLGEDVTAETITAKGAAVAALASAQFTDGSTIGDILGAVVAINAGNFKEASENAQIYGKALAALSGLDAASGALENTLNLLFNGLKTDDQGVLTLAATPDGAILLAAMQEAQTLLNDLISKNTDPDNPLPFEKIQLPTVTWAEVTATFADKGEKPANSTLDRVGGDGQPSIKVSWQGSEGRIQANQTVALYTFIGEKSTRIASHILTADEVAAGALTLAADSYGDKKLANDGVKRLFTMILDDQGAVVARSEMQTYGLVSVTVDRITALSTDTGFDDHDFVTNQPTQSVSGHYTGQLNSAIHRIEVSADGGASWVVATVKPAAGGGGTWTSAPLTLPEPSLEAETATQLLTRVIVSGVKGEQPLMLPGASHDFVLDVTPPDAVVASIDSISQPYASASLPDSFLLIVPQQTISGTVSKPMMPKERVEVSIDGGKSWTDAVLDGQRWSAAVTFGAYGGGDIMARTTDLAGNLTEPFKKHYQYNEEALTGVPPTQAATIDVVTDAVSGPADSDASAYDYTGPLASNMSTDDRKPTLSGTLSAKLEGDQVLMLEDYLNGSSTKLASYYVNVTRPETEGEKPTWTFTPTSNLALGHHTIVAKVYSPASVAGSKYAPEHPSVDGVENPLISNWGSFDLNVQSISFTDVTKPGATSTNILNNHNHVTDYDTPILAGYLGSALAPNEVVAIYDTLDKGERQRLGQATVTELTTGMGAKWSYTIDVDEAGKGLKDGVHQLRAVIEQVNQDEAGVETSRVFLLGTVQPVIISTETPTQIVTITTVKDDVGIYQGAIMTGASTDDTTPSLTGTLDGPLLPGQQLVVRVENNDTTHKRYSYTPVLSADGLSWSLTVAPGLPVGDYTLTAGVINGGGGMGTNAANFELRVNSLTFSNLDDAVGSKTGNIFTGAEPFMTDDSIPTLRGQLGTALGAGETLQIVSIYNGVTTVLGNASFTPLASGQLSWTLALDASHPLPNGKSTLSAQVIDTASKQLRLAVDRVIHVDNGVPNETLRINTVNDNNSGLDSYIGPLSNNQSTDDRQPMISGQLLGGVKALAVTRAVQIIDSLTRPTGATSETVLGLATLNNADGSWRFKPANNLELGDHRLSARVINLASGQTGQVSDPITVRENQITFDTVQDKVGVLVGNLLNSKEFPQPPYTDDPAPQMSGTLRMPLGPNERVAIYDQEQGSGRAPTLLGVATVRGTSWNFTPGSRLSSTAHVFQVRLEQIQSGRPVQTLLAAVTPAITIDISNDPVTQTVDTLVVTDKVSANGSATGAVQLNGSTDDRKPLVSGTLSAALKGSQYVHVYASQNGVEKELGKATVTGTNWTYTPAADLSFGLVTISARIKASTSGLTSNTISTTVNVNGITLNNVTEQGSNINVLNRTGAGTDALTLHGKLQAPLKLGDVEVVRVYYQKNGGSFLPLGEAKIDRAGTGWSLDMAPNKLGDGAYRLSIRIEDSAKRTVRAITQTDLVIDTSTPDQKVTIDAYQDTIGPSTGKITNSGISTDDPRGIVTGQLSAQLGTTRGVVLYEQIGTGDKMELIRLGEATVTGKTWTFRKPEAFITGAHQLVAKVENLVANKAGMLSEPFVIKVQDVVLDSITQIDDVGHTNILLPAFNGAAKNGQFTIKGHLSTALATGEKVQILIDDSTTADAVPDTSKPAMWSYTMTSDNKLTSGIHTIVAQIVNADGSDKRALSPPRTVYIDNGRPDETVTIVTATDHRGVFLGPNPSDVSSDDPLPILAGTVSAVLLGGRGVAIYTSQAGTETFLGYASVSGTNWTYQVKQELSIGETVFKARVVNRADREDADLQGTLSDAFIVSEQGLSITALIDDVGKDGVGAARGNLFLAQTAAGLRTHDLKPKLIGHLDAALRPGEQIDIYYGSAKIGTVKDSDIKNHIWSFTPDSDLAPGAATFSAAIVKDGKSLIVAETPTVSILTLQTDQRVTLDAVQDGNNVKLINNATDSAGLPVPDIKFTSDQSYVRGVQPVNVKDSQILDDSRPQLSGTLAKPLSSAEVLYIYHLDSSGGSPQLLGKATTAGTNWSLSLSTPLPAGVNQLQAIIENKADSSDVVKSDVVTIDMVSLSPLSVDGLSSLGAVSTLKPGFSGTVRNPTGALTVQVNIDGTSAGEAAVDASSGAWSFTAATDLSLGLHRVDYVLCKDGSPVNAIMPAAPVSFTVSGSDAPSFKVTKATDAPAIILTQVEPFTTLTGSTDAQVPVGSGIMVAVNGKAIGLAGFTDAGRQNWSYTLWAQPPGKYEVTVKPVNLATLAVNEAEGAIAQFSLHHTHITIDVPSSAASAIAPNGDVVMAVNPAGVTLSGKVEGGLPDNVKLSIWRANQLLGDATTTTKDGVTTWSYTITQAQQSAGVHQYGVAIQPNTPDAPAVAAPTLSAQTGLSFIAADSGPSNVFPSITGFLADRFSTEMLSPNATITSNKPVLRGEVSAALAPQDKIVIYGKPDGADASTLLGEVRMLTATTWEFNVAQALPYGNYTIYAVPQNRLTGRTNEAFKVTAAFQIQHVTITDVLDTAGVITGNIIGKDGSYMTDDGKPVIKIQLAAALKDGQYLEVSVSDGTTTTSLGKADLVKEDNAQGLKYSAQPSVALSNGTHTLSVRLLNDSDHAHAIFTETVSFVKDDSTPAQTVQISQVRDDDASDGIVGNVAAGNFISYHFPLVSGTISDKLSNKQVVRIWQDNGSLPATYLGDATVNNTAKTWTWRSDKDSGGLPSGNIKLFATVDNAAQTPASYVDREDIAPHGKPSPVFNFRILGNNDITAHAIVNGVDTVLIKDTDQRQFTISGKLSTALVEDEFVEIKDGNRLLGYATVNKSNNTWDFKIDVPLEHGQHDFKITIDRFGSSSVSLVFNYLRVNVYEADADPLQAGQIENVFVLPEGQVLAGGTRFDDWMWQGTRSGQSLDGSRVGIYGTLALAPRVGDVVQVYDGTGAQAKLLGEAATTVRSGTTYWYYNMPPLDAGKHTFSLRINGKEVASSDVAQPDSTQYVVNVLSAADIFIDTPASTGDTQAVTGSLASLPSGSEELGVYRTLNGQTVRLGKATINTTLDATDQRYHWSFTPDSDLPLALGRQTLTVQVEGATHSRVAAKRSLDVVIDEASIRAQANILSVAMPQADGLVSLKSGQTSASAALLVSGSLDQALIGSEKVALYRSTTKDGVTNDALIGYATVDAATGRAWTYALAGLGNGDLALKAAVVNDKSVMGPKTQAFSVTIAAPTPGQTVMLAGASEDDGAGSGRHALGSSMVALDTKGFSIVGWDTAPARAATDPTINYFWNAQRNDPIGQTQRPQLDVPLFSFDKGFPDVLPATHNKTIAYAGSGWFHVSPEQAGVWSFQSWSRPAASKPAEPLVNDFGVINIDGTQIMVQKVWGRPDVSSVNLDAGWHYFRFDTGNSDNDGAMMMKWRRPGESDFSIMGSVAGEVWTGPAEQAVALGAASQSHHVTLNYSLSAPLGTDETLKILDLTAHRTADGLRLQFWNLPTPSSGNGRTWQEELMLTEGRAPVVSRMSESLAYNITEAGFTTTYGTDVNVVEYSTVGRATGWFYVAPHESGTWLLRDSFRFDMVLLKVDGHTLLSPDSGFPHGQMAAMHLEAGWHYLDSTLTQLGRYHSDWDLSVIKPGQTQYSTLTGFAQFESAELGAAEKVAGSDTSYRYATDIADGNSHTLWAAVEGKNGAMARPMERGESGMVFLANGAFGIIDKTVSIDGDGQRIDFADKHGAINAINLDADATPNLQGNTLIVGLGDLKQADVGTAAAILGLTDSSSPLLDAAARQLTVFGGEHDVLRFDEKQFQNTWAESGQITAQIDSREHQFTVFSNSAQHAQVIVDTHIQLDLEGALRSNAHPVI